LDLENLLLGGAILANNLANCISTKEIQAKKINLKFNLSFLWGNNYG